MFQVTITNTFPSEDDCDMFVMVLQQQWPTFIDKLPGAELSIFRSEKERNVMQASWMLQSKEQAEEMQAIGDQLVNEWISKSGSRGLNGENLVNTARSLIKKYE